VQLDAAQLEQLLLAKYHGQLPRSYRRPGEGKGRRRKDVLDHLGIRIDYKVGADGASYSGKNRRKGRAKSAQRLLAPWLGAARR